MHITSQRKIDGIGPFLGRSRVDMQTQPPSHFRLSTPQRACSHNRKYSVAIRTGKSKDLMVL